MLDEWTSSFFLKVSKFYQCHPLPEMVTYNLIQSGLQVLSQQLPSINGISSYMSRNCPSVLFLRQVVIVTKQLWLCKGKQIYTPHSVEITKHPLLSIKPHLQTIKIIVQNRTITSQQNITYFRFSSCTRWRHGEAWFHLHFSFVLRINILDCFRMYFFVFFFFWLMI